MTIEPLATDFSVCKVTDYSLVEMDRPFIFTASTDIERSLVCPTEFVPENATDCENGWKAFRIVGTLDFSLIGIIANITKLLAERKIGVFVVSTFDTDYVLVKQEDFDTAVAVMVRCGYEVV